MRIVKPTLLVDQTKCERNIERMVNKGKQSGASLRPHFKTHHSALIGDWFRSYGVDKCTVSSVSMAQYFVENGWKDLTIAFPYNPLESDEISELASRASINILIGSEDSLRLANERLTNPVGYFIKIDIGTHRTGIDPKELALIEKLVNGSTDKVRFQGFLAHAGHTYRLHTDKEITEVFNESIKDLISLRSKFGGIISYGDTPSCSVVDDLSSVDEIRAGNFVFYDWMQQDIGSCEIQDIGVCLACPIVAIHENRNEIVIYGGGVHLSKDFIEESGMKCYGKAVSLTNNGWDTQLIGNVVRLSQEHGIIHMSDVEIQQVNVGDLIGVIPVHSCLAADLQGHYFTTDGQKIEKIIKE